MSNFSQFYCEHFVNEHKHPVNRVLHAVGTVGGTVFAISALTSKRPWLALLYPVVFAAPGLLGHYLYESNAALGHLCVTRKGFPSWYFWLGNHVLTGQMVYESIYGKQQL